MGMGVRMSDIFSAGAGRRAGMPGMILPAAMTMAVSMICTMVIPVAVTIRNHRPVCARHQAVGLSVTVQPGEDQGNCKAPQK